MGLPKHEPTSDLFRHSSIHWLLYCVRWMTISKPWETMDRMDLLKYCAAIEGGYLGPSHVRIESNILPHSY